jgi:hypothetical protein
MEQIILQADEWPGLVHFLIPDADTES